LEQAMKTILATNTPRYLFEDQHLPKGFKFPSEYLELTAKFNRQEMPDLMPWFWLSHNETRAKNWLSILRKQFPEKDLIPFCKDGDSDDIACFDASDISGNPAVLIIHTFCKPGYEFRGKYMDFSDWLNDFKKRKQMFDEESENDGKL
jgi:hypothetical protein